ACRREIERTWLASPKHCREIRELVLICWQSVIAQERKQVTLMHNTLTRNAHAFPYSHLDVSSLWRELRDRPRSNDSRSVSDSSLPCCDAHVTDEVDTSSGTNLSKFAHR